MGQGIFLDAGKLSREAHSKSTTIVWNKTKVITLKVSAQITLITVTLEMDTIIRIITRRVVREPPMLWLLKHVLGVSWTR